MPVRRSIALLGLAAVTVAWALLATDGSATGLISIVPVLLLLGPLLLQRYPGERGIARLRAVRSRTATRARPADAVIPATPRVAGVRGGMLLARRLAVRPPPARPAHA